MIRCTKLFIDACIVKLIKYSYYTSYVVFILLQFFSVSFKKKNYGAIILWFAAPIPLRTIIIVAAQAATCAERGGGLGGGTWRWEGRPAPMGDRGRIGSRNASSEPRAEARRAPRGSCASAMCTMRDPQMYSFYGAYFFLYEDKRK